MSTREPVTPAITVLDILARQAAEHREHARNRGIAATDAKAPLKEAASILTARREHIEELEEQLAEIKAALADARAGHQEATARHAEALAVHAQHEAEAQQAADIAESLDRIAAQMRGRADVPPAEALAATGLMPKQVIDLAPHVGHDVVIRTSGGTKVAGHLLDADREHARVRQPDDMVCTVAVADVREVQQVREIDPPPGLDLDKANAPDAPPISVDPFGASPPVVAPTPPHDPDQPGTVVAVSGPLVTQPDPGAAHPVPNPPTPSGSSAWPEPVLNSRPLPPAEPGKGRHERSKEPKEQRGSRWTGGFKLPHLGRDEQPHEQDGDADA